MDSHTACVFPSFLLALRELIQKQSLGLRNQPPKRGVKSKGEANDFGTDISGVGVWAGEEMLLRGVTQEASLNHSLYSQCHLVFSPPAKILRGTYYNV